jgi:hypothetical protein
VKSFDLFCWLRQTETLAVAPVRDIGNRKLKVLKLSTRADHLLFIIRVSGDLLFRGAHFAKWEREYVRGYLLVWHIPSYRRRAPPMRGRPVHWKWPAW